MTSRQEGDDSGRSISELFEALVSEAVQQGADEAKITAALEAATQAAADALAERLKADSARMLREHHTFRTGFEWRLQQRWGQALDLYECVWVCCMETGEEFVRKQGGHAEEHRAFKLEALTLLHGRACLIASEIHAMLRTGHAVGAQARWRTLHELAVVAYVLGRHNEDISERFLLHRYVERFIDAKHYQKYCEALGYEPFSDETMGEIRRQCDEVVSRYGATYKNPWGWAKALFPAMKDAPSFAKLEELAGLGHFKPWFGLSSHGIHGGATGALHIRDFYGRGKAMLCGPSNAGLADPGSGALISLYQVTTALLVYGGINSPEPLDFIGLKAISGLLDEARTAFFEAHHILEAEEAAREREEAGVKE